MTALDALTTIIVVVIVPAMVWLLGRTGWTGDRKRLVVLAVAVLLGLVQAALTEVIALPTGWADLLGRGLITTASTVALSQALYQMLWTKLPDTTAARRALSEGEPTQPLPGHAEVW